MKTLRTFTQKDIFPEKEDDKEKINFEDRVTGKAIVFDDDKNVALVGTKVNSFYLLPGGGIDQGESIEVGIIRECLEEIGCNVELKMPIGTIDDYRNRDKKHCINYCYTAKLVGEKGELTLTEDEKKNGLHVIWVPLDEAIKILEKEVGQLKRGEVTFYNTGFNILRDHLFLKEAKRLL
jgi:ADP-ribose pyrophosphatase YjhB (NUDIX family)